MKLQCGEILGGNENAMAEFSKKPCPLSLVPYPQPLTPDFGVAGGGEWWYNFGVVLSPYLTPEDGGVSHCANRVLCFKGKTAKFFSARSTYGVARMSSGHPAHFNRMFLARFLAVPPLEYGFEVRSIYVFFVEFVPVEVEGGGTGGKIMAKMFGKYCVCADYEIETLSDLDKWCQEVYAKPVGWNTAWESHLNAEEKEMCRNIPYVGPAVLFRGEKDYRGEESLHTDITPVGYPRRNLQARFNVEKKEGMNNTRLLDAENKWFNEFKEKLREVLAKTNPHSYSDLSAWDYLALAQHYGLCTRCLDWTVDPVVALWFALNSPAEDHRQPILFALRTARRDFPFDENAEKREDPYPCNPSKNKWGAQSTKIFKPSIMDPRISAQKAYIMRQVFVRTEKTFSGIEHGWQIEPVCDNDFYKHRLFVVRVTDNRGKREKLCKALETYHIRHEYLLPDIPQGISGLIDKINAEIIDFCKARNH